MLRYGNSSAFTTNPAWSFTVTAVLPHASTNARASASVASDVVIAGTSSTSDMAGAGLKKWMPHTRSGRPVTIAISTTGSVDVLVARIADGVHTRSSSRKSSCFAARSSTIDSRTRSHAASSSSAVTALDTGAHLGGGVVVDATLLQLAGQRRVEAGEHRVGARLGATPQHHLEAGRGGHFGHACAHDPGTDHTDALARHLTSPVVPPEMGKQAGYQSVTCGASS